MRHDPFCYVSARRSSVPQPSTIALVVLIARVPGPTCVAAIAAERPSGDHEFVQVRGHAPGFDPVAQAVTPAAGALVRQTAERLVRSDGVEHLSGIVFLATPPALAARIYEPDGGDLFEFLLGPRGKPWIDAHFTPLGPDELRRAMSAGLLPDVVDCPRR